MATLQKIALQSLLELEKKSTEVKSLKMLMTKFVAANVGNYIHGKLTLENLPFSLREMVLHQLMQRMCRNIHSEKRDNVESVDCMIQAYLQLVGVTTKKIELGGFISLYLKGDTVQNVTKILEAISQKATNLEHLDFQKNTLSQCFHYYPCLEKNSVEAIIRLEYLKIIHFSRIEYINVKLVCKNLKKLQYVECIRLEFTDEEEEKEDIEADIEEFKASFSRLRVFLFNAKLSTTEMKVIKLCIRHLPKLEIVYDFADTKRDFFHMPAELAVPEETSALRHLHAAPTTFDLPAAFPNVTHLKADCTAIEPENKYASILRFSNIESLNLRIQPFAFTLNSFLEAYGGNLHTLMIESKDWLNFSFSRIFDACPKLRKIELGHILILDDMKPLESFAQLRELHWKPKNQFEMTNILSAPNLERVYLSCRHDWISVENLRKLMSLVADKKILSKLTSFSLRLFGSINYREINYDLLRALRDFVAVAAVHLPKLVNFKFWLGIKGRHPRLPRYFQSDNPEELGKIGTKFQEWIGDDTIVEFIRAINVRKQL